MYKVLQYQQRAAYASSAFLHLHLAVLQPLEHPHEISFRGLRTGDFVHIMAGNVCQNSWSIAIPWTQPRSMVYGKAMDQQFIQRKDWAAPEEEHDFALYENYITMNLSKK